MSKNTKNNFLKYFLTGLFIMLLSVQFKPVQAQSLDTGVDLYSTYVWRGVAYLGPCIQPYVEFSFRRLCSWSVRSSGASMVLLVLVTTVPVSRKWTSTLPTALILD
ncbi:MAG: hypothetical protein U5K69_20195 [Balneolaceae bacterium]|nr:hypothetical protein [Balneolaceae bacterium]